MEILKPFMMLASAAFVAGFAGYLAVARISEAPPESASWQTAVEATATTPPDVVWSQRRT